MSEGPTSPLGGVDDVANAKAQYPALAERIDDLERIVTPEFDRTDRKAIETQSRLKRARLIEIAGGALVALFALVRLGFGDDAQWAGVVAAVIAAGTGVIAVAGRQHGLESWLDNRRVAEELRSLYFSSLIDTDDREPAAFRKRLRTRVSNTISVEATRMGPERDDTETSPASTDTVDEQAWALYRTARLRGQIDWMQRKTASVEGRTKALQSAQVVMMAGAAVCGLLSGYIDGTAGQALAVPVAATAVIVGFLATVDAITASDRLAQHYERTARRLTTIDNQLQDETGSLDDVEQIESVLMAEHRAWHRITEGNQQ